MPLYIITVEEHINYEGSTFELHEEVYKTREEAEAAVDEIKEEKKESIMCDILTITIYEIQKVEGKLRLNLVDEFQFTRQQQQRQQRQQRQRQGPRQNPRQNVRLEPGSGVFGGRGYIP